MYNIAAAPVRRRLRKAGPEVPVSKTATPGRKPIMPTPPSSTKPSISRPRGKSANLGKRKPLRSEKSSESIDSIAFSIGTNSVSSNLDFSMHSIDEKLSALQEKLTFFE